MRYKSCRACVECRALTSKLYAETPFGKTVLKKANVKHQTTDKHKQSSKAYRQTKKAKLLQKIAQDKYRSTEKGKATRRRAEKKYAKTEKRRISSNRKHSKRRSLIKNNRVFYSKPEKEIVFSWFGFTCAYCGNKPDKLTADHFIPLASGGADALNNIVPACLSCNASKQNKSFENWYFQKPFFDIFRMNKIIEYIATF